MIKITTKEEARAYLSDTAPDRCFWINNGQVLKNLEELENTLQQISDETFMYHVNKEKNDFSRWINEIIGDKKLANDLLSSKSKDSTLKKVKNRLSSLKKKAS